MKVFIGTGTVTYANKAASVLNAAGVPCRVVKRQARSAKEGCGYGVEISGAGADRAMDRLRAADVRVRSVEYI